MSAEKTNSWTIHPEKRVKLIILVILLFIIAALLGGLWWFLRGQYWIETNDAYVSGNIIPVNNQTHGTISKVLVENTEHVQEGQILATLQGSRATIALHQAAAHLGATVRELRRDYAQVTALQQRVQAKKAELRKLNTNLTRYQKSIASGAVSAIRIENTENAIHAASAEVAATQAALKGTEAIVAGTTITTNPLTREAVTAYEKAYINWARRIIRAPVAGYIAERAAYPGMMVHPGERLFSVVPLNNLWVVANIKETDMRHVYPGQTVQLTSYYYGNQQHYQGKVLGLLPGAGSAFSILPPENATGNYIHIVERVPVRIALPSVELARHPLRPGLSMIAEIHWQPSASHSVLKPLTVTPVVGYQTPIYADELHEAQRQAATIIQENS